MATTGKRLKAEQIVNLLREIDVFMANGKTLLEACKRLGSATRAATAGARYMAASR